LPTGGIKVRLLFDIKKRISMTLKEKVHKKVSAVVSQVNTCLPEEVYLHETLSYEDEMPIIEVVLGPNDPYIVDERIGSFVFFSAERQKEKYKEVFGSAYNPDGGKVFVAYYDDESHQESPLFCLDLDEPDYSWSDRITRLFR
jgi:hypothetical protein